MAFDLEYLVDNGTLRNWPTDVEPGCTLARWRDDNDYSILDANGKPLGWGDSILDAVTSARIILTDRRRQRDGIIPAKVCG
jgi:hypothetical protein